MSALSNPNDCPTDRSEFSFATMTPADLRTCRSLQSVIDTVDSRGEESAHHMAFLRRHAGTLAATRSPVIPPGPVESSSGFTTEVDHSDDEENVVTEAACYVLSLSNDARPFQPEVGFWFGTGDLNRFGKQAGVDLLLPPSNATFSPAYAGNTVYPRQGHFAFDTKYAQLWLHARHKGIRVNDRPLAPRSKILLESRARISIGPYRYIFEFKVSNEKEFQAAKREFLAVHHPGTSPHDATSATPSASDICVQGWLLHGIVGSSPVSVVHAATNIKSGEVVAVKRLRFGSSKERAEQEVRLYGDILESIKSHRYSSFVMQKHSVLENERPYATVQEVYLLWKPLARGDFSQFGVLGQWRTQDRKLKKQLFVQTLLGLLALHECGWIHRDLKPANLGVVELGNTPFAVIMDEGQAVRRRSQRCVPRIAHCGTIGYLAPELENDKFASTYDTPVDVWSMGAVAYFLFVTGRIPWSTQSNMFVPEREAQNPSLHLFREIRADLVTRPAEALEHLIGDMLDENPRRRPTLQKILSHPTLRGVRDAVDRDSSTWNATGQKRNRSS